MSQKHVLEGLLRPPVEFFQLPSMVLVLWFVAVRLGRSH